MQLYEHNGPPEDRQHGTALFPLAAYPVVLTPGPLQEFVNLHWHQEVEFMVATRGRVNVQIRDEIYTVEEGDAVFIHGQDIHGMSAPSDADSEFCSIVFNSKLLSSSLYDIVDHVYLGPLTEGLLHLPTLFTRSTDWETKVLNHLWEIIRLYRVKPLGYEIEIKGLLYLILATIAANGAFISHKSEAEATSNDIERLKAVLSYIDTNFAEPIRIRDLADIAGMSEGHFCRFFKRTTHKRPVQHIIDVRMAQAAKLLQETEKSVLDIAMDIGFGDASYFIKTFRRVNHCTPNQYRHIRAAASSANNP